MTSWTLDVLLTLADAGLVEPLWSDEVVKEAREVVTYNIKDFPDDALAPYGMHAIHPDSLLMKLAESSPDAVMASVRLLTATKRRPPRSIAEEVAGLRVNMLP